MAHEGNPDYLQHVRNPNKFNKEWESRMIKDVWDVCAICGELQEYGITFNPDVKSYSDTAYFDFFICEGCIDEMKKLVVQSHTIEIVKIEPAVDTEAMMFQDQNGE